MACDLCESCDDRNEEREMPSGGKYCKHEHGCECSPPTLPEPPKCRDGVDHDDPGVACDPAERIRELEETVETSKAEAAEAEARLADLNKKQAELKAAVEAYKADTENRKKRKRECHEFVKCKRPDIPEELACCVDEQIDKVCKYIRSLEDYAQYLDWAWGQAQQTVRWKQWEYDRLLDRYTGLRELASSCHTQCEEARKKYDEACADGDETLKYLYWKIAKRLAEVSKHCCDDYERKLCDAFEALCAASEALAEAKKTAKKKSAKLDKVKKRLENLKGQALRDEIERLVNACCDEDGDSGQTSTEQSSSADC